MDDERPRLLIIDDEPMIARLIAGAADDVGFAVHVTHDDEEFRAVVADHRADAISLDLGMPRADGIELIRFLGGAGFAGPVMVMSGFDRRVIETAARLGRELGLDMRGPVSKPARMDQLCAVLEAMRPGAA